jgi:2-dehydropantoate 2-reductase
MRFVIYGAGAVGGTIGAALDRAGYEAVLIARGAQLAALRRGLRVETPEGTLRSRTDVVGSPRELRLSSHDVVLMAMKGQHSLAALDELLAGRADGMSVVCAQNGVENERLALRRFAHVYGMFVWMPAQLLEPGVIQVFSAPKLGVLDLGRVPSGCDARAEEIAQALSAAGFASRADGEIMRWKYGKLLSNLANAVEALLGPGAPGGELVRAARAEALSCYAAARISYADREEIAGRTAGNEELKAVAGHERSGGSSWQSLARRAGSIETTYLNGEIVLLGRLYGVPTPVNCALTELALEVAADRAEPGSLNERDVEDAIAGRPRRRRGAHQ